MYQRFGNVENERIVIEGKLLFQFSRISKKSQEFLFDLAVVGLPIISELRRQEDSEFEVRLS